MMMFKLPENVIAQHRDVVDQHRPIRLVLDLACGTHRALQNQRQPCMRVAQQRVVSEHARRHDGQPVVFLVGGVRT